MDYEVEGVRPRGCPKKTCSDIIKKDCQSRQICHEDAMVDRKWRKLELKMYISHKARV